MLKDSLSPVTLPFNLPSTTSNMYLSSLAIYCYLTVLTSTSAAPISFRIRQIIKPAPPSTQQGVHVQMPQDVAIIDSMGFRNNEGAGTQNATCHANDTECVMGNRLQVTATKQQTVTPPETATAPAASEKRTRWTKRIPQEATTGIRNPDAGAAVSFVNNLNAPSPSGPLMNQTCPASDTNCVTGILSKRNPQEVPASSAIQQAAA